ncbi:hypothetical protein LINGRAPRIM_LOCUS2246 [Linum grandiflorum]
MALFHRLIVLLTSLAAASTLTTAVKFQVITDTTTTLSTFDRRIGMDFAKQTMTTATSFIFQTFNQRRVTDRKKLQNVTVFIDQSANHSLLSDNQFRVGVNYFSNLSSSAKREFAGIVHYYMTYVWGWNGRGKTPAGLISGTADYVRWKAGYGLDRRFGSVVAGQRWDQGYEVTARFLDYCGGSRLRKRNNETTSFVAELNGMMKDGYNDGYFNKLMGKSVEVLWSEYKRTVGDRRIHPSFHYL